MTICIRCNITGRVQGVFFRASTQREAQRLGITGYASNMPDGSVEVLACGAPAAIEQLQQWLKEGPPMARVDEVSCQPVDTPVPGRFTTG